MDEELRRFVHELHFETDKAKPPEWEADWNDAPLPYKLYRGLPAYEMSTDIPLSLAEWPVCGTPGMRDLAHFLWYAYGTAQISRSETPPGAPAEWGGSSAVCRRVVPSGGGLYPNELYVYSKLPDLPRGIYHYDTAHHRLLQLREGDFDGVLETVLGHRFDVASCFGAVFLTTVFWKNFFKYADFSYRLQGLDTGVLLGQLLESGKRFGYGAVVCYQFLDRAAGRLLGLQEGEESVYAVVLLTEGPASGLRKTGRKGGRATAEELIRQLPELRPEHYVRSRRIRAFPRLVRMDQAARLESAEAFRTRGSERREDGGFARVALPEAEPRPLDFAALSRKRYSPENDFVLKPIRLDTLAGVLRQTAASCCYRNDLDEAEEETEPRVSLCVCVYGVEALENGAYRYDGRAQALRLLRPGDHRAWLQYAMTLHNVNLFQVPLNFHVTGERDHGTETWGARGYRIQQMEAGMMVQRLLLQAAGAGMAGRPLLGYEADAADDLYRLPFLGETALIQVPIGPYRYRSRWEAGLYR